MPVMSNTVWDPGTSGYGYNSQPSTIYGGVSASSNGGGYGNLMGRISQGLSGLGKSLQSGTGGQGIPNLNQISPSQLLGYHQLPDPYSDIQQFIMKRVAQNPQLSALPDMWSGLRTPFKDRLAGAVAPSPYSTYGGLLGGSTL